MDLRAILFFLTEQVYAVLRAPVPFAIAVVIAALIVWRLMHWQFGRTITRLRKSIGHRDSEILLLKANGARAIAEPKADTPLEQGHADAHARRKALRAITNAIDGAALAPVGDRAAAERAMPNVGLALLASRKTFGLPAPAVVGDTFADLEVGRRYLELVRPALFAGDDAAALRLATEFMRRSGVAEADPLRRVAALG